MKHIRESLCLLLLSCALCACGQHQDEVEIQSKIETDAPVFTFTGSNYQYTIHADYKEVFAGNKADVFNGAGKFRLLSDGQESFFLDDIIPVRAEILSENSVKMFYQNENSSVEMENTYSFFSHSIQVDAVLTKTDDIENISEMQYILPFTGKHERIEKRVVSKWQYPDDRDFPYRIFDSIADIYKLESGQLLYCFQSGEDTNANLPFEYYPEEGLRIFDQELPIENHLVYVLEDEQEGSDIRALFHKDNEEIGVKIQRKDGKGHTVFKGEKAEIDIYTLNLSDIKQNVSIEYRVYDYEGNIVSHQLLNKQVFYGEELVTPVDLKLHNSGIYFLDLQVGYHGKQYRELYPFAVLQDYTYVNSQESHFGVSGVRFGRFEENETLVEIMEDIGVANLRVCLTLPDYLETGDELLVEYLKKLKELGIKITGQIILDDEWEFPTDKESSYQLAKDTLNETAVYLYSAEIGNENNGEISQKLQEEAEEYKRTQFEGELEAVKEQQLKVASAGIKNSSSEWIALMENMGVLDETDILSTHSYSWNLAPERNSEDGTGFLESLKRIREYLDGQDKKLQWHMSEFGCHTAAEYDAGKYCGVNPRTQADYVIREFMLGLSYHVDVLMCYNLVDGQNLMKSIRINDGEDNFGMFYKPDYYGRIMPKPLAVSFANMTRNLENTESVDALQIIDGTKYLVHCNQKDGSRVTVAWSTKEILNTEQQNGFRLPGALWENQWKETEILYLQADGAMVVTEDIMGISKIYPVNQGIAEIPLQGTPIFIISK